MGVNAAAVSVNCEMTVLAADVRTAATSGVGPDGCWVAVPPQAPIRSAMNIVVTTSLSFIICPSCASGYFFLTSIRTENKEPK